MENSKTTGWKHKSTNKLSEKQKAKVGKVMHEFKEGELHSGSKKGPIVKDRDQAIAIALAEAKSMDKMSKGGGIKVGDVWEWHGIEYDPKKGDNYKIVKQVEIIDIDSKGQVKGRYVGTTNNFIVREPNKYLKKKVTEKMKRGAVLTPLDVKDGDIFKTIDGDIIQLSIINSDKDGKYYILRHHPLNNSKPENTLLPFEFDRYYKAGLYEKVDPSSLIKKENKMVRGGYTKPGYDVKTTGVYLFKTKNDSYYIVSYLFERENDTEDSLEIQDDLRGNLGSILIQNSAWKRLSSGKPVKARSAYGDYIGALTRIDDTKNLKKYITGTYNDYAFKGGGWIEKPTKIKKDVYKFQDHQGIGYIVRRYVSGRTNPMWIVSNDEEGSWDGSHNPFYTKKQAEKYIESFFKKTDNNKYEGGGVVDDIKTKYQIAGSDKYGVYTYSKRVADEIANIYGGDVQEDGSKWYVRLDETYEGGGTIEVGDKVKASKEYGGKSGRVIDKMGSFVVVEYSNGQSDSYHESDLIKKHEEGGGLTGDNINADKIIGIVNNNFKENKPTIIDFKGKTYNIIRFKGLYVKTILFETDKGDKIFKHKDILNIKSYSNGKSENKKMKEGGGIDLITPDIEAKKLMDKLKVVVVPDDYQGSNKEIIKLRVYPNSKPGDRFYDNRSSQAFRLEYNKGKYKFTTAGGYNRTIQTIAKLLMLPIRSNTGYAGRSNIDTSLNPINISQSEIKNLVKIMQDGLRDESKSESDFYKKMSGGKLTALIEDMKEFDKNIYPKNSDVSYKNRLIIAHFKTKGYSIIEIAKALKIIRN